MRFFVMTVLILLVIVGGVAGTYYAITSNKKNEKPRTTEVVVVNETVKPAPATQPAKPVEKVLGPGEIRVFVASRPIYALRAVTVEDISNNARITTQDLNANAIDRRLKPFEGRLDKIGEVVGRVAKRDIGAGVPLFESDFFPPNTREGLVASIPPGKRAMIIDAGRLPGVHNLRSGDRVDLVAAIPVDLKEVNRNAAYAKSAGLTGVGAVATPNWQNSEAIASPLREAEVRILVDNGMIAVAAKKQFPGAPLAASGKGSAGISGSLDGLTGTASSVSKNPTAVPPPYADEVTIVMSPDEVPLLTQALAIGAQVLVIPRSGMAETDEQNRSIKIKSRAEGGPSDRFVIEQVIGDKKSQIMVTGSDKGAN